MVTNEFQACSERRQRAPVLRVSVCGAIALRSMTKRRADCFIAGAVCRTVRTAARCGYSRGQSHRLRKVKRPQALTVEIDET